MTNHFIVARPVLEKIEQAGFQAYFVGGCVRDYLLNKRISDIDIASSAYPEEIKSIFSHTIDIGIEHGTVLALVENESYEITTFRTESTYQDYRRPQSVEFVRDLKEDLMRRDFTINALAMDKDGKIFDYYDGIADLNNQIIRAVGSPTERFNEDALRIMRAARFSAQLGFKIEELTQQGMYENAHLLKKIAIERIAIEFQKMMAAPYKSFAIPFFLKNNLHKYCPQLENFENALLQFGQFAVYKEDYVNWALLLYFSKYSLDKVPSFLRKWKVSNLLIYEVTNLLKSISYIMEYKKWSNLWLFEQDKQIIHYAQQLAKIFDSTIVDVDIDELYLSLPIHHMQDLEVNGKDVMELLCQEKAGIYIGEILNAIKVAVLTGVLHNDKLAIEQFVLENYEHYKGNL